MRFYQQQHEFYCGVDLHARSMHVCIVDHAGQTKVHKNIDAHPDRFLPLIRPYREGLVVAAECMFAWYWLADLCAAEDVWLHADAAYGGFAALTERGRTALQGPGLGDSISLDPHKWMSIPVECGCVLVRDKQAMRDTFSLVPAYLRDDRQLPWFSEFGPQHTRGFRARW